MQVVAGRHRRRCSFRQEFAQSGAERIRQAHVGDAAITKERLRSLLGPINELIRHHHVPRTQVLLQRPHCRH